MRRGRTLSLASCLLVGLLWSGSALAHDPEATAEGESLAQRWTDLALTTDCEAGFQSFIRMAQDGRLGDDVTNANVGIWKNHARIELVRAGAPSKLLLVTPRNSNQTISRYFNIEAGEGATGRDVARVAHALDQAFDADPFQLAYDFFNAVPGGDALPNLATAWRDGGWKGAVRALERRMAALAGLPYTIAVIVALAAALLASLCVLWGSPPHPPRSAGGARQAP
jgi:hypothetical protein